MISKCCLYFHRFKYLNANRVQESSQIQPSLSARVEIIRRNPNLLGCRRVSDFLLNVKTKIAYFEILNVFGKSNRKSAHDAVK